MQVDQIISLPIQRLGNSGEGVGYFQGYPVFVEGALPGEVVEAQLFQCQKNYGKAHLINISKASPARTTPPCKFFGKCGGCQLMHLSYSEQLEIKRQRVVEALQRLVPIEECLVAPCLPSPQTFGYRNKIQLPVRKGKNGTALGLYARSSNDLIEIDHCLIHCPLGEQVFKDISAIIKRFGIIPYDPTTGEGELRHLLIKSAIRTGEVLVALVTNQQATPLLLHLAKEMMTCNPHIKGIVHNIQQEGSNVILGPIYNVLEGRGFIEEQLCGLSFKISAASFFQVNPNQAEFLYAKALEYAELSGEEILLDAYCGVGTLSLFFAKQAKKVIGIECVPEAIVDAQKNAQLNGISNASFICDSAETVIASLRDVDVVLLNPPRKGCEPAFLEGINQLKPRRVVYISCDPVTLARDLKLLHQFGFSIDAIQPYDMFPQTAHVECVVRLKTLVTKKCKKHTRLYS